MAARAPDPALIAAIGRLLATGARHKDIALTLGIARGWLSRLIKRHYPEHTRRATDAARIGRYQAAIARATERHCLDLPLLAGQYGVHIRTLERAERGHSRRKRPRIPDGARAE